MERISTQKPYENDTIDVPHDILENILVRLPVKSLLRFKAVSRTWEATICDPIFARFHLQQSMISGCKYIFIEQNLPHQLVYEKFKLIKIKNKELQVDTELDYPGDFGDVQFMCYSDGLLLLKCYIDCWPHVELYALWNPSTTAFIMFDCPYSSLCYHPVCYGFCYDPSIEHYKVVIGNENHYTVFNCRNKRWTAMKKHPITRMFDGTNRQGVSFNGSLYWLLNRRANNHRYSYSEIVRFDPRDEKFKKVHKLEGIQNDGYPIFLVLLGVHLCLYYSSIDQLFIMEKDDDRDSWMEFITIDIVPWTCVRPLFMTNENEIILSIIGEHEHFLAHDIRKNASIKVNIHSMYINSIVYPFVESLILGTEGFRRYRRQRIFEELRLVFFLN